MKYCPRKNDKYTVRLFDSTNLLPAEWNALLPQDHFLQSAQLSITEKSKFPDVNFLYAFITLHGKPFALAYFQLLHIKPYHLETSSLPRIQQIAWKLFNQVSHPKLLVAGHLFRHDIASFYCVDESSVFEVFQSFDTAIRAALRQSCAHAVLVKDMPEKLITYFSRYAPQYLLLRNDVAMEMQLEESWQTFSDYEKSLKHKYAQRLRKVRKHWETLTIKELNAEEVKAHEAVIFDLYMQVCKHQQVRMGYISSRFIPILKERYAAEFHVWMAYENEHPVAFFSAWSKGDDFDMFYIGFDYDRNEALQLYFNILFFSIEQALLYKKKKLILGRTALEAKARIGCKPNYLSTYLYIKNPVVRTVMFRLQQTHTDNEGEWENRHPFK